MSCGGGSRASQVARRDPMRRKTREARGSIAIFQLSAVNLYNLRAYFAAAGAGGGR
jgi:hypothetical protein